MYESTITFTLDTICPWTYLAKKRLDKALSTHRSSHEAEKTTFTLRFAPYQLYPQMSTSGEQKREWYAHSKYQFDESKFAMFETVMNSYAEPLGFKFNWNAPMANTLEAHRVIQVFQGGEDLPQDFPSGKKYGPETVNQMVDSLYRMHFEEGKHPSAQETLLAACTEAGVEEADARRVVVEEKDTGLSEVKGLVRMVGMDGVDSVPTVMFEGRRRDLTLTGAKEFEEYEKSLRTIVKESS
ncbi:thioredoxin-like protein [Xylariales sp. AK1849]|nr:thioredoxin-like protein [Xylariales sp. AK1849]